MHSDDDGSSVLINLSLFAKHSGRAGAARTRRALRIYYSKYVLAHVHSQRAASI
jgi:hypothetical protein